MINGHASARGQLVPLLLVACLLTTGGKHALAQDAATSCAPAMARVVSIQGSVDVQRAGSHDWLRIRQLDTAVCPGDRMRTAPLSRAALFVQPETLVRVDQNTTIALKQTTTEVLVEFFQDDATPTAPGAQCCGAAYFITRFPKKFRVTTAHLNAAVEGTEFMVTMSREGTELAVLEGVVLSQTAATLEERAVSAGEKLVAAQAVPAVFSTLIKPKDAVQWVLHYPPLSDAKAEAEVSTTEQCLGVPAPLDQDCLTKRAELLLRLGQIDEALRNIDSVLALDSGNGDANALRALIQITKNDKSAAMESARAATVSAPNSMRAWLALSYAEQASFELDQALASARNAQALQASSSLANTRVAELLMSLGRTADAETSARAAVNSNPAESGAHAMLGFIHLAQIDIKQACADFETAIGRDSFSPLPRLGLGLAMIRGGKLIEGREQLEIAVALDPSNSLLRSYVGKAYYEENSKERDELASTQFDLAKELDPRDPTPWFYDSILKDSQTRPAEALKNVDKSADLNDDRAVYRSRQMLDLDLAARNASQATVYNELGFHQRGVSEAAQSLAVGPASGSAHRFLADVYAAVPRHEIARASELLQAQLRQPLGAPPLQPQLANDVLFKSDFFGPATIGLNEFNPLFIQDGQDLQFFGLLGDNDTWGEQAIFSGLQGPWSFSLSQFATDTDGYRPNNDDRVRQYDGFLQWQIAVGTSAQIEITSVDRKSGDLQSAFDPAFFSDTIRNEEKLDTQRLGIRQVIDPDSDILVSVIRQDRHASLEIPDPFFPATIISDQVSWKAEAQYLTRRAGLDVIVGASYFDGDSQEEVISPPFSFAATFAPRHLNAYSYVFLPTRAKLPQIQLGVSYDDLTSDVGSQSEVNPKIGIIWKIADSTTLRAAGFRALKRRINSDQGLEPTQLAGFNQFFDDQNGAISEGVGLAADFLFLSTVSGGLQVTRRDLTVPYFDFTGAVFSQQQREDVASGYLYWLPNKQFSVSLEPRYHDFDHGATFETMKLTEVPLAFRVFSPNGLWMGISVTEVEQRGVFDGPGGVAAEGSDSFWLVDAIVAYRLPRRMGTISLQGTNLLGEKFQFQEIDQAVLPRYIPEAQVLLRVSASF